MTNPKQETLYCEVCGTPVGTKPGEGAVLGLMCLDPICRFTGAAGINDARNALVVESVRARTPVQVVAEAFGFTRQRIYQIVNDWSKGG